ncbi:MAG: hypothetical protein ACK5HL_01865 [Bacilli bacterium]
MKYIDLTYDIKEILEENYINEMKKLEKKIYEDKNLSKELKSFNELKKYNKEYQSKEYKDKKLNLHSNNFVKEYLKIENELNLCIIYFNNKLKKLKDEKGCNHACN